jgi:hypothetical protein
MGYIYRYTDIEDGIIKYVGIVWSENRTLLQRVKEHQTYDDWCNGKQWRIEYMNIDNKTDCEGLEAHFISLYNTSRLYNKSKTNWGISNVYSMINWEWRELNYHPENIEIKNRESRRINDSFLSKLYNDSIYVFNNGMCYCFFKTFKREPIYVYMALSPEDEKFAIDNKIRYMNREQLNSIIQLIEEDNKLYGYSLMPDESEQIKIENNLSINQCYTYKKCEKEISKILEQYEQNIYDRKINVEHLKRFIRNCVYEMKIDDIEYLQEQKLKIYNEK